MYNKDNGQTLLQQKIEPWVPRKKRQLLTMTGLCQTE